MITIQPFDDSTWKQKIADYRQSLGKQKPTPETPQVISHMPYPYQRVMAYTRNPIAKPPLQRLSLPQKAPVTPEISVFWGIHQIVNKTRRIRQLAAKSWHAKWLDPFTYFDEDETPYNKAGGIDIDKAIVMAWGVLRSIGRVETESLINLYEVALRTNEKIIYLAPVVEESPLPANIIQLPVFELSRHPRTCAWCGTKTSSGIRALCDQHHVRYIVNGDFRNSPINYDDLARLIIQSDARHRIAVMEARALKAAS